MRHLLFHTREDLIHMTDTVESLDLTRRRVRQKLRVVEYPHAASLDLLRALMVTLYCVS